MTVHTPEEIAAALRAHADVWMFLSAPTMPIKVWAGWGGVPVARWRMILAYLLERGIVPWRGTYTDQGGADVFTFQAASDSDVMSSGAPVTAHEWAGGWRIEARWSMPDGAHVVLLGSFQPRDERIDWSGHSYGGTS